MTENYASKRERWQKQLNALPAALRGQVSLRNIETVSALAPQAQETLALALQSGLKHLPRALAVLDKAPGVTVSELLEKVSATPASPERQSLSSVPDADTRRQLADLIQGCYPDMPRISAEALSAAEALAGVLQVLAAQTALFNSPQLQADFVRVVFHASLQQALKSLEDRFSIAHRSATSQTLEVSNA
jgi:hypothetical protein